MNLRKCGRLKMKTEEDYKDKVDNIDALVFEHYILLNLCLYYFQVQQKRGPMIYVYEEMISEESCS